MTDSIERRLVAVMFTDVVGYTAIMQNDEKAARAVRFRHRRVLEQALGAHGGELLQYLGDGSLSVFSSAVEAVRAAIQVQKDLQEDPAVPLRIGIHVGEISHDTQGVYGDSVNIAARVQSLGRAGSVLISEKAQDEIKNQPGLSSASLGRFDLKNVEHPLGVYAVVAEGLVVPTRGELVGRPRRWLGATAAVLSVAAVVVFWPRDAGGPPPPSGATSGPSSPPDTQEVQPAPVVVRPPTADPLPRVASVVVALPRDTLRVGDRVQLSATAATAGGDPVSSPRVDWVASDSSIARVDGSGAQPMLVALSPGRVSVTATIDGVRGTATAHVIEAVTALNLSPDGGTLALGDTATIEVTDQDGRPLEASFESSDPAVATVSEAGMLEGQGLGQITLHVSADSLSVGAIFTFGAAEPEEVEEDAASDSIAPQEVDQEKTYLPSEVTEPPLLLNEDSVTQAVNDNYPPLLRDDNIGGRVTLELTIDENGYVLDAQVWEQCECRHQSLNEAALTVARSGIIRFTPAKRFGVDVNVQGFQFPVIFEAPE